MLDLHDSLSGIKQVHMDRKTSDDHCHSLLVPAEFKDSSVANTAGVMSSVDSHWNYCGLCYAQQVRAAQGGQAPSNNTSHAGTDTQLWG
jgi:hypothetical protein